jgi:hypothetical protein
VTEISWWVENYRVTGVLVLLAMFGWGWFASPKGATFVYRITSKKGECLRVGIAQLHRDGLAKRMKTYRTGRDRCQREPAHPGDWSWPWARWVRWWLPPVPYRLARLLRRRGVSHEGVFVGWWPGMVTLELKVTRKRAAAYETRQIETVKPRFNKRDNDLHRRFPGRQVPPPPLLSVRRLSKVA